MNVNPEDLTCFVGAGASVGRPAGLPLFGNIREQIYEHLLGLDARRDQAAGQLIARMAPEALFRSLDKSGFDLTRALIENFNARKPSPNAVHQSLGGLLSGGATVWTTNYDTLIEETVQTHFQVAELDRGIPSDPKLLKPHGSLPLRQSRTWGYDPKNPPSLVFQSDQLIADLDPAWTEALEHSLWDRGVAILGYRGMDVDIYPVLKRALSNSRWVVWFASIGEREQILRRFPGFQRTSEGEATGMALHRVVEARNPSEAFLRWLHALGWHQTVLVCPRGDEKVEDGFSSIFLRPIQKADVLANLGMTSSSESEYRLVLRSRDAALPEKRRALKRILRRRASSIRRKPWARALMRLACSLPTRQPFVESIRDLAAEDMRSNDVWPRITDLEQWIERSKGSRSTVSLNLVKMRRYRGELESGALLAHELLDDAQSMELSSPQVAGLTFQLIEILRMQGDVTLALEMIERGLTTLAGTSLTAWTEYERLACRVQRAEPDREVRDGLVGLRTLFEHIGEPLGPEAVDIAFGIHLRQRGRPEEALIIFDRLVCHLPEGLLKQDSLFHLAETYRVLDQLDESKSVLTGMNDRWFLHRGFRTLLSLLIDPQNVSGSELVAVHNEFQQKGSHWGAAIVVDIAESLSLPLELSPGRKRQAQEFLEHQSLPRFSRDPAGWTFSMV